MKVLLTVAAFLSTGVVAVGFRNMDHECKSQLAGIIVAENTIGQVRKTAAIYSITASGSPFLSRLQYGTQQHKARHNGKQD
ncbi:hypothetical protein IFM46972_11199 [Aspergillus udagawae]|uniref:Uncharacterized protein n=1 Tax=Aspergillus udagawae TaxID=91492 RepID=A0A8H3XQX9_9EURO|nr:hypothetical protein IFM46972_11199 [Aspergillus udagawae]